MGKESLKVWTAGHRGKLLLPLLWIYHQLNSYWKHSFHLKIIQQVPLPPFPVYVFAYCRHIERSPFVQRFFFEKFQTCKNCKTKTMNNHIPFTQNQLLTFETCLYLSVCLFLPLCLSVFPFLSLDAGQGKSQNWGFKQILLYTLCLLICL